MRFTALLMSIFSLTHTTTALPNAAAGPSLSPILEGYQNGVLTFRGSVRGEEFSLDGSIQEVHAQLQDRYPDLTFPSPDLEPPTFDPPEPEEFQKRQIISGDSGHLIYGADTLLCMPITGWDWQPVSWATVASAQAHLESSAYWEPNNEIGFQDFSAPPNTCASVYCHKASPRGGDTVGIFMCNSDDTVNSQGYNTIGNATYDMMKLCTTRDKNGAPDLTGGQEFFNWYGVFNIIVRKVDSC